MARDESHYKKIINKQKAIIKKLSKKSSRSEKREERYLDLEEREASELLDYRKEESKSVKSLTCPLCKHELDLIVDGTKIKVYDCSNCDYRSSVKIKESKC